MILVDVQGKSDLATSASDMPGSQDVRFPSVGGAHGVVAWVDVMVVVVVNKINPKNQWNNNNNIII